jgi:hypothetical protein
MQVSTSAYLMCPYFTSLNQLRYFAEINAKTFLSNIISGYFFIFGRVVGFSKNLGDLFRDDYATKLNNLINFVDYFS